jgi:large subunit ribosomal protein L14
MTRGLASNVMKSLTIGSRLVCDDNSGAKLVEVIGVIGVKGRKRKYPILGVGNIAIVAVKKGTPQMIKKVERALVIRQKSAIRRPNGLRVTFEDNAVALVDETGLPKGTEIKGVVAREIAVNFSKVVAIAAGVI